ncbi:MAG: hypothetical protein ACJZ6A_00465 [Candidatus Poseidoniaceae archaeon]
MGVKKSAYRQPVTPEGLKAIENGTLTWLDDEMLQQSQHWCLRTISRRKES